MRLRSVLSFAFAAVLMFACSSSDDNATGGGARRADGKECGKGESRECVGPGACKGAQICNADRDGFEACDCGSGQTGKGGTGGSGGSDGGAGTGGTESAAGSGGDTSSGGASSSAGTGGTTSSGGASSGKGGTGGSGTPGSTCDKGEPGTGCEACTKCVQNSICKSEWTTLQADPDFTTYAFCLEACSGDTDCLTQCGKDTPDAAAKFNAYAQCTFCKACSNSCEASTLDDCK